MPLRLQPKGDRLDLNLNDKEDKYEAKKVLTALKARGVYNKDKLKEDLTIITFLKKRAISKAKHLVR